MYQLAYTNCGDEVKFAVNKLDFVGANNYSGVCELLNLHSNPFLLIGNTSNMKGRQAEMDEVKEELLAFIDDPD